MVLPIILPQIMGVCLLVWLIAGLYMGIRLSLNYALLMILHNYFRRQGLLQEDSRSPRWYRLIMVLAWRNAWFNAWLWFDGALHDNIFTRILILV